MALKFPNATRQDFGDALNVRANAGTGHANLRLYSSPIPTNGGDAPGAATLLADIPLNDPCFSSTTNGVCTINVSGASVAASFGGGVPLNAAWFRIIDANAAWVADGTVTATGGGGDLTMPSVSITSGLTVTLTAPSTITIGNAL